MLHVIIRRGEIKYFKEGYKSLSLIVKRGDNMIKEEYLTLLKYIFRRLLQMIPLLILISFTTFIMLSLAPGDPVLLLAASGATPEIADEIRESLGLDKPILVRYYNFLVNLIFHGDLGRSFYSKRPVTQEIAKALPISIHLAFNGVFISTIFAIILGVTSAVKQYSFLDNITKIICLAGVSIPVYWLGLVMIIIFSVNLNLFPSFGWGSFRHMVLPSVTLAAYPLATLARLTRSTMLEEIRKDYIRTARSKGVSESIIVYKHALRNALIPVITMAGLQFGRLISASILTETVFAIPGIGRLAIQAIYARDYPIIQGAILAGAFLIALINLMVDISYTFLDPRIKI